MSIRKLTNTIREELLQLEPQAALVVECAYAGAYEGGSTFTVASFMERMALYGIDISADIVQTGLRQLRKLKLIVSKKLMKRTRGRPPLLYRLPSPSLMRQKLGITSDSGVSDPVSTEMLTRVTDYRKALHHAFIKRRPGQYTRQWLGERLGVTGRTTWHYEQDSDIVAEERIDRRPLTLSSAQLLPERAQPGRYWLEVVYTRDMTADERTAYLSEINPRWHGLIDIPQIRQVDLYPAVRFLAERELRRGHRVYLKTRNANYYYVEGHDGEHSGDTGWDTS